jgi:hypothetical protein
VGFCFSWQWMKILSSLYWRHLRNLVANLANTIACLLSMTPELVSIFVLLVCWVWVWLLRKDKHRWSSTLCDLCLPLTLSKNGNLFIRIKGSDFFFFNSLAKVWIFLLKSWFFFWRGILDIEFSWFFVCYCR